MAQIAKHGDGETLAEGSEPFLRGVLLSFVVCSRLAIRPSSVFMPIAVTTPVARPLLTWVL